MRSVDANGAADIFAQVKALVLRALSELRDELGLPTDAKFGSITVERPKGSGHGEISTNAALLFAKSAKRKPRELAERLAEKLGEDELVYEAEPAGPGFVNMRLQPAAWMEVVRGALEAGSGFGRPEIARAKRINVEFVSANPTGPLHVGNARGAVFGDALGRLLEFAGHEVTREYYINDGGAQTDTLARSVYLRYLEANGEAVEFEGNAYKGGYLIPVGERLKATYGRTMIDRPESEWLADFRQLAVDAMMDLIRADLAKLNVHMDVFFSERSLYDTGRIEDSIRALKDKGLVYEGVLEPPKGKANSGWRPRKQQLFKSTAHGDDNDRPIMKPDGSWTYFAPDIAYHHDKITRGYDELINVFGADHGGYSSRIRAVVSAFSDGRMPFDVLSMQMVKVVSKDGAQRMSKRLGNFVLLAEAIDAVGPDVARFVMLMRRNDAPLDFDFDKVREQSRENPVFYVQYAHARVRSLVEKSVAAGVDPRDGALAAADLSRLTHPAQVELVRRIAEWPRVVAGAARTHEPHRIAFYLYDLASDFHAHWTKGNELEELRFLQEGDPSGNAARIALARSAGIVLSCGLGILGVVPMARM